MFAEHTGEQLLDLLRCGGFGVLLGLFFDLLSLLTPTKAPKWAVAIRDAVAVILSALTLFLISLPLTAGRLRWYLFAGAGLGLWLYRATLHRVVRAAGTRVRRGWTRATRFVDRWQDRLFARPKKSRPPRHPKKSRSKPEKVSKNY